MTSSDLGGQRSLKAKDSLGLEFGSSLFRMSTANNKVYLKCFPLLNSSKYSSWQLYSHETDLIKEFYVGVTYQMIFNSKNILITELNWNHTCIYLNQTHRKMLQYNHFSEFLMTINKKSETFLNGMFCASHYVIFTNQENSYFIDHKNIFI